MKLYTYWRSSAAYRVRIALNLKAIDYRSVYVSLINEGGEQLRSDYAAINPQCLVPSLELDDGQILTQSLAIVEYLDEAVSGVALLPSDAMGRARVRALAQAVACDIHPLNNLRVLKQLELTLGADTAQKNSWYRHWIEQGFAALETLLVASPDTGIYCHGQTPGLADLCLVPQLYNARRFQVDLTAYPTLVRIDAACAELEAFVQAAPEAQGDAQ
tara:strand:+ start:1664 stop:2311 length:648 start_codon:yes stop_codon:yes gene_type:complete